MSTFRLQTPSSTMFKKTMNDFIQAVARVMRNAPWHDAITPADHVLMGDADVFALHGPEEKSSHYTPYIQKTLLPAGTRLIIVGDLHGDGKALESLLHHLIDLGYCDNNFTLKRSDVRLIFLGDYINRGENALAVCFALMQLYLNNPSQVFLLRGNHESARGSKMFDKRLQENKLSVHSKSSFLMELRTLNPDYEYPDFLLWYDYLPMVLYAGVEQADGTIDYVQYCHGGLELGHNPSAFLHNADTAYAMIDVLDRTKFIESITDTALAQRVTEQYTHGLAQTEHYDAAAFIDAYKQPVSLHETDAPGISRIGYLWNLFLDEAHADIEFAFSFTRRTVYLGQDLTHYIMHAAEGQRHRIHALFRGHQHIDETLDYLNIHVPFLTNIRQGRGLIRQWNGTINTLGCTSDVIQSHSWLMLICDGQPQQWQLRHYFKEPIASAEPSMHITPLGGVHAGQAAD
jgi:hypothetical protein